MVKNESQPLKVIKLIKKKEPEENTDIRMQSTSTKRKTAKVTISMPEELLEALEQRCEIDITNRSNFIAQLLMLLFHSSFAEDLKQQAEIQDISIIQITKKALEMYFDYSSDPKLLKLADTTHRNPDQMLAYLIELGYHQLMEE